MKIDKTVETPGGKVVFQGEVEGVELDAIIEYGLNTLLALGAIKTTIMAVPTKEDDDEDDEDVSLQ